MFAMDDSARSYDLNGYMQVRDNPISKVGVFPYLGSQIGAPDPNKIYMVYRPAEELGNPETVASFRLLPWVDDHAMLGPSQHGLTPPEQWGVHGVIGEDVYFDGTYLRGNLVAFSDAMKDKIEAGEKVELSPGYRCRYSQEVGIFNSARYDFVQRDIRGNHLALVHEGRTGPDVAVQDELITIDSKEFAVDKKPEQTALDTKIAAIETTVASVVATLDSFGEMLKKLVAAKDEAEKAKEGEAEDEHDPEAEKLSGEDAKALDAKIGKIAAAVDGLTKTVAEIKGAKPAMDEKTLLSSVAERDQLAAKGAVHFGAFAHDAMTLVETAKYLAEKAKLTVDDGNAVAVVKAWLQDRPAPGANLVTIGKNQSAMDGASPLDAHYATKSA